ncbi:MAG: maltokinase [Pseudonocardiales bacterium]|nr:maltokinase [Pseudonocardiales bacterium]
MIEQSALQPLVERWLPNQRWFAGKGRSGKVSVRLLTAFGDGAQTEVWTAQVVYEDGDVETYQLPLVAHTAPSETLEHVLLGTVESGDGPAWVYDALHDKDITGAWLRNISDDLAEGSLRFRRYVAPDEIPLEGQSLVLTAEQSNTSLRFDDQVIVKVFRRLQPGINPDIEIHAALGEFGGKHVARLLGSVECDIDGEPYSLAMAQEFMTTATDGWELAKASVRDLLAEADLHAEEAGGDFAGEAWRLGVAIAETHADLAAAFGTTPAVHDAIRERAIAMRSRLEAARDVVAELDDLAPGLRALYDEFAEATSELVLQRIHGDLHLGQALRTVHRWVLIDFEGEPMAALADRRLPDTPLRDIAGMLRSFAYAGHHRLIEGGAEAQLAYRADEWTTRNRAAFCDGYADAAGSDPRAHSAVLRAFEADKAVYEAVYEARNRPTWLPIPLASLARLAEPEGAR